MQAWLECPRGVYLAAGARSRLPALAVGLGRRLLLVTGRSSFKASGAADALLASLGDFEVSQVSVPAGEPTVEGIEALRSSCAGFAPELIVGIGGGSVLDTAKALSGLLRSPYPAVDHLEGIGKGRQIEPPVVPWIALPTTAGTGAEATRNAVLKSAAAGVKKSLRSLHLLPAFALVDPELAVSLPARVTGESGLDALTQLVEAAVTIKANPPAHALALDAFPRMMRALPRLAERPSDVEARSEAAYGALASGIALANSGLGAVHGFASALGGVADIPHGLICASFLPAVLRENRPAIEGQIGELLGEPASQAVESLARRVEELTAAFGLAGAIRGYGVAADRIPEIARLSEGSSMSGNPVRLSQERKEAILRAVLLG